ncbi:uncharacterized protein BKA78DRAFT_60155 [Phyllosticta capitalensis]|uniref:uncharacterized protein n=1 Tax=Phyllosticta capitalensis TaxID=121624 RepID=UPI00312F058C
MKRRASGSVEGSVGLLADLAYACKRAQPTAITGRDMVQICGGQHTNPLLSQAFKHPSTNRRLGQGTAGDVKDGQSQTQAPCFAVGGSTPHQHRIPIHHVLMCRTQFPGQRATGWLHVVGSNINECLAKMDVEKWSQHNSGVDVRCTRRVGATVAPSPGFTRRRLQKALIDRKSAGVR